MARIPVRRRSAARRAEARPARPIEIPNLVEVQLRSYEWFITTGLRELFDSFSPIEDFTGTMSMEFLEYFLGEPKYDHYECRDRTMTYEMPLKVKVRLVNKETGELKESEVYLGEIPCMTERGTFVINGAERVVVSQLSRSPGAYFHDQIDFSGRLLYTAQVIPLEGAWLEVESDPTDLVTAKVGPSRKMPFTTLLRAVSGLDAETTEREAPEYLMARSPRLKGRVLAQPLIDLTTGEVLAEAGATIDAELTKRIVANMPEEKIAVMPRRLRCGSSAQILQVFGERVTLAKPKAEQLVGKWTTASLSDPDTRRVFIRESARIDEEVAPRIEALKLDALEVWEVPRYVGRTLEADRARDEDTAMTEVHKTLRPGDPPTLESARSLLRSYFLEPKRYDLGRVGRYKLNHKLGLDLPVDRYTMSLTDLVGMMNYFIKLERGEGETDDIDHLRNKRVRSIGELLQKQLRSGMLRMERVARERLTSLDRDQVTAQAVISIKPITAAVRSFFASGQLSQFMDQTNPLAELTHKRRISVLGPGGLSRQSAKLEVRDVHHSHYGRVCPIETPEGPNIGLIGSLATHARIDQYGFIEAPYRKVVKGRATDEIIYLTADLEESDEGYRIAPATTVLDETGRIVDDRVAVRHATLHPTVKREEVDLIDVAAEQVFSIATSLIPFLENDDANRALMGSNMQRQAVPLVRPESPIVKTGLEGRAATDSGAAVIAEVNGVITEVESTRVTVESHDGTEKFTYPLRTFLRSNQATCIHQRPLVRRGQRVRAGDPIVDGPATQNGELALGRNLTVAFMLWEGYNYEDAIILSERIARDDVLTSIHIEKYEVESRETKLGPEEITRDIPNVGEEQLRNLDEHGVVRIGAEVEQDDILVGKVAPKSQGELTAEERLVIAIFGKKAEEMRDASLKLPHGEGGTVVDVRVFSRNRYRCEKCRKDYDFVANTDRPECELCGRSLQRIPGDELKPSSNQMVRAFVAQRRKIMEGDKMAGRHGNKGVVSRILPEADMPYLPDGTPVDIILNPLGVPSRMNIGQILEMHLGLVGRYLGRAFPTPIFQGYKLHEIIDKLKEVAVSMRTTTLRHYVTSELELELEELDETASFESVLEAVRVALQAAGEDEIERLGCQVNISDEDWDGLKTKQQRVSRICEELTKIADQRCGFDPTSGKSTLIDGRTGEAFNQRIAVGQVYMMKLAHLVEDKIHARSTGPYSLVTQQPLGGKAQFGGQRFGEMEVWALEAYGAAHTLQEILTIKSDDVSGRVKTYESVVKGDANLEPGVPESFKILVKELQSLGLRVTVESEDGHVMELRDNEEEPEPARRY